MKGSGVVKSRRARLAVTLAPALVLLGLGLSVGNASVQFNGINGYAFASDAATFDFSGSFTIELQFQSSVAQNGCLLAKFHQNSGTALDDSYYILVQNDGSVQARIQTDLQLVTLTAPASVAICLTRPNETMSRE